jgi:hypothetical protein
MMQQLAQLHRAQYFKVCHLISIMTLYYNVTESTDEHRSRLGKTSIRQVHAPGA